ncbi:MULTISPECIES: YihY/virulence factor BrkB family protein [unclassified Plantactinospora]|uniref:YihY/virulence factor BrkB family protein n=1 Tax=unclassified Plantactinospora TaxID=2631981 RepID=UPI000D17DFAE|nr:MULTISPECIES: YihY/virulence factor BrkB family protein [unclassified Plantactinospora]AVT31997.1 ribonuclease [Plantactinospora sp. BC1]AVT40428.1 ribonuclease [Plantactinospora sp. BB1]
MASTTEPVPVAPGRDRRLPGQLRQLRWSTWRGVLFRSVRNFVTDNCADWAAALTYYGVLALFPSAIVIVALVGLVSSGEQTIDTIAGLARDVGAGSVVANDGVLNVLRDVVESQGSAKVLLGFGVLAALWSASGYVGAFTRASNAIYGVAEGRPFYLLRPLQLGLTAIALVLLAVVATGLIVSGPVTDAVGDALGLGDAPRTAWTVAKWPVLVAIMMLLLSLLFWIAPNVRQPRFRWLTVGGTVALASWAVVSAGFGFYVSRFDSYNVTYGSLGAIIAFLVWLYLSNCAVMLGVEINAEVQRGRARQGGAEDPVEPALPPRSPADDG